MKFLKVTDQYGTVQIVNARYIVKILGREDDDAVRVVFTDGRESLTVSEPTFEELETQLTLVTPDEETP